MFCPIPYFYKIIQILNYLRNKPGYEFSERKSCFADIQSQIVSISYMLEFVFKSYNRLVKIMQRTGNYAKITLQTRKRLVELVLDDYHSIYEASKILNLKYSTAKLINKRFRQDGTFFVPKSEREDLNVEIQEGNAEILQENQAQSHDQRNKQNTQNFIENPVFLENPSNHMGYFYMAPSFAPGNVFWYWP